MYCSLLKHILAFMLLITTLRWDSVSAATRWQPSIIWDRFNPLLKCKCNWMKMAELQNYDRVELVCPTPYLVSAYREKDISRALVFYKIYMRIFNITTHTMEQLQESLNNGSFCDPEHKETKVLHSCKQNANKDDDRFFKLRFNNLNEGDIAVVFSNTVTGDKRELNSTKKLCSMVFVVNVTQSSGKEYDMSYGKCFQPFPASSCSDIEKTYCGCRGNSSGNDSRTQAPGKNVTHACTTPAPLEQNTPAPDDGFKTWYFFVGVAIGVAVGFLITVLVILFIRFFVQKKENDFPVSNDSRASNGELLIRSSENQPYESQRHYDENPTQN